MKKTIILAALLAAAFLPGSLQAGQVWAVSIDTQSIAPSDLVLLLQFNGLGSPDPATATVDLFSGAASFTEDPLTSGATAQGSGWVLDTTVLNALYLDVHTVGPRLSFSVTFAGAALDAPNPSADLSLFGVDLLDPTATSTLDGFPFPGLALEVGNGAVVRSPDFDLNNTLINAAPVPEPGTLGLLALGGALGFVFRRRAA